MENRPLPRNVERRQGVDQARPAQGFAQSGWECKLPHDPQCQSSTREATSAGMSGCWVLYASWFRPGGFLFAAMPGQPTGQPNRRHGVKGAASMDSDHSNGDDLFRRRIFNPACEGYASVLCHRTRPPGRDSR